MTNDALSGELSGSGTSKKVWDSSSFRHFVPFWRGKHDAMTKGRVFTKPPIEKSLIEVYQKVVFPSFRHGVSR